MARGQGRAADIMTVPTEGRIGLPGAAQLRGMRVMAGLAIAIDSRLMPYPVGPIPIDLVTAQTKLRLLLQQVNRFIIAMGMMADSTVLMS